MVHAQPGEKEVDRETAKASFWTSLSCSHLQRPAEESHGSVLGTG